MKNKKLIRNVPAILTVVMMTTVMVLSSCGNTFDSEHANITIRLSGSGSGRAISDAEKSAATFNVYFNDSLVASNVSGTYNGTAQVGTTLNIRVDALVNGKRIACGENTITVKSVSNDVDVKLNENREQSSGELKGVPQVGSIIMSDGSLRTSANIGSDTADAIAVVYKVSGGKAWAVGKVHEQKAWCDTTAAAYRTKFTELQTNVSGSEGAYTFTGYQDGSGGWQKLKAGLGTNDDTNQESNYPAWEWVNNYGKSQDIIGELATGWYFPSVAEVFDIWKVKSTVNASLNAIGGNEFGSSSYSSSSTYQSDSYDTNIFVLNFSNDKCTDYGKQNIYYVCAVRQFTY